MYYIYTLYNYIYIYIYIYLHTVFNSVPVTHLQFLGVKTGLSNSTLTAEENQGVDVLWRTQRALGNTALSDRIIRSWWLCGGFMSFKKMGFDGVYHDFLKFKLDSRHYNCLMGVNEVLTNHIWRFNQIWDTHWDRIGCYGILSAT